MMDQKQIDALAEALRRQGLTWSQTNFAVSLVRNAESKERERCAKLCESLHHNWRWDNEPDSDSGPRACAAAIRGT